MVYVSNVFMKEVYNFIKELENDENIKNIMKEWKEKSKK